MIRTKSELQSELSRCCEGNLLTQLTEYKKTSDPSLVARNMEINVVKATLNNNNNNGPLFSDWLYNMVQSHATFVIMVSIEGIDKEK